jgi:cell division protein FtsQ
MSRAGATQGRIKSRRGGGQAARLTGFFRRIGFTFIVGFALFWLCVWAWLADAPQKMTVAATERFYTIAAAHGFAVKNIYVEGRENVDSDVLRALLNVDAGDPIFAFDPAEGKELIQRLSWVREAHVERRLPDTIYIGLVERVPLALWQNKGKVRLIDADGVTLATEKLDKFSNLIILVGEDAPLHAPAFMRLLNAEPDIKSRIEAATWVGDRRWDLKLDNGAVVKMPEGDLGLALRRLALAQDKDKLLDREVEVIDLREENRITVSAKPGAAKQYQSATGSDI